MTPKFKRWLANHVTPVVGFLFPAQLLRVYEATEQ